MRLKVGTNCWLMKALPLIQAGFTEGELVVLSLEAVPGRRPQPAVARALVAACDVYTITLSLQRQLRASLANPPAQVPGTCSDCATCSCAGQKGVCPQTSDYAGNAVVMLWTHATMLTYL